MLEFSRKIAKIELSKANGCWGFPGGAVVNNLPANAGDAGDSSLIPQCRRCRRLEFDPWVVNIPCRMKWLPTPVFLPGKCHGQRSLAGYSQWGREESEQLSYEHTVVVEEWGRGAGVHGTDKRIKWSLVLTSVRVLSLV